jgi:NAD-dependent DNA ligase
MGKVKNLESEFEQLQKTLLKHKYLYYVKSAPIIGDYDYDMLELESFGLAKKLGFNADRLGEPQENEKEHVHWMVDFDENHPLAKIVIAEVDGE